MLENVKIVKNSINDNKLVSLIYTLMRLINIHQHKLFNSALTSTNFRMGTKNLNISDLDLTNYVVNSQNYIQWKMQNNFMISLSVRNSCT